MQRSTEYTSDAARSVEAIDRLLDETERLARSEVSGEEFFPGLARRLVTASSALGCAVWLRTQNDELQVAAEVHSPDDVGLEAGARHALSERLRLVADAFRTGGPQVVPLDFDGGGAALNAMLFVVPFGSGQSQGAIELIQRFEIGDAVRDGCLQLVGEFCEIAAQYAAALEVREVRRQAAVWPRFEQFIGRIHASLDLRETAFAIVNEGRALIGCDHVALLAASGRGCRTLAVSGADAINRRSQPMRRLEQLAAVVMRAGEPMWYDESAAEQAPQIERPLQAYLETSPARGVALVPLVVPRQEGEPPTHPFGVLVVEQFQAVWDPELHRRAGAAAAHCAAALRNALEHRTSARWPVVGRLFARPGAAPPSSTRRWVVVAAAIGALLAALWIIPADFDVPARGQLVPAERRNIYAPDDGIVRITNLKTSGGNLVRENDVVAVLRSPQLDRESTRIWGELATVQKQLDALLTARLKNRRGEHRPGHEDDNSLAARERELLQKRDNLRSDLKLLQAQSDELTVRSPVEGQVLTADVVRRLNGRPVRRGDVLMRVGRFDGPWELDLELPEQQAGYVREAQSDRGGLAVSFQVSNQPGRVHTGRLKSVSPAAAVSKDGPATVRVVVVVDDPAALTLRAGATVTARLHCGRRSLGYVWFHDVIDRARQWFSW